MKRFIFSIFFFSLLIAGAQAQQKSSCSKTCTKSAASVAACQQKAPGVATADVQDPSEAAAKLASMDESIESRTDANTGTVTYVRKETCSHSGKVSFVDVSYDAGTNTFVNVAPSKVSGTGTGCSSTKAASGKSCCASGVAAGKSCCASKGGTAVKTTEKVKS